MIIERRTGKGKSVGPSRGRFPISQPTTRRPEKRSVVHQAPGFALALLAPLALALGGCIGPVALHQAALGYDKTVHRLESEMLLLNIARMHNRLPNHYTVTSFIAATFDYRTSMGLGADFPGFNNGRNKLFFNAGAAAAENPTMSIMPVQGEEFTRRILAGPDGGGEIRIPGLPGSSHRPDQRLIADGIEVQKPDGTFGRFILNRPEIPQEYREVSPPRFASSWAQPDPEAVRGDDQLQRRGADEASLGAHGQ
jgi:hypothetical protein